jgi:hypothetical protein
LFEVLGAQTEIGRTLPNEEILRRRETCRDKPGILAAHLGGNADVLGKTIPLSGNNYTVVVLSSSFETPLRRGGGADVIEPEVFVAPSRQIRLPPVSRVHFHVLAAEARVSIAQAQSEMEVTTARRAIPRREQRPAQSAVREGKPGRRHSSRFAAVVRSGRPRSADACANFANLLLAASRHREIAVRSPWAGARLVRQMLTESALWRAMARRALPRCGDQPVGGSRRLTFLDFPMWVLTARCCCSLVYQ